MRKTGSKVMAVVIAAFMLITTLAMPCETAFADSSSDVKYTDGVTGGAIYFDESTGIIYNCDESVTEVVIPEKINGVEVTSIGEYAFSKCKSLTSITISKSVTSIGEKAFYICSSLTSITISDSVTSIGENVFYRCSSLTSIIVDEGNKKYSSNDGILYNKMQTELICCPPGKKGSFTIPDSVTNVGNYAFYACELLTSITISGSVTSIGEHAFGWCANLRSIRIPNSVTSIGNYAFTYCQSLTSMTIPDSVTSIGEGTFDYCSYLRRITIPDSVTSIGKRAFFDCHRLTSITIPDSVTSIGDCAFNNCQSLTSITIPDSVMNIGVYAFSDCKSLTSIIIPDSVTSIGKCMFWRCNSLTSITIPNSVMSVGYAAFSDCKSLTSIAIPDSVTSIEELAFDDCDSLTSIIVAEGNMSYSSNDGVLYNKTKTELICSPCGKKGSFAIPDSVTSMSNYAFASCSSLTSITIPDGMTSIGEGAFYDCSSLTSITIPDSVTSIEKEAFGNCSSLTSIIVPDSVMSISPGAFNGCSSLTIYGYEGSYAEKYADSYNRPFVAIGSLVSEDQLFGKHASYLINSSYKNMCGELGEQVDEIIWGRSDKANALSAFKSGMKAGAWNNVKSIIGGFTGKFYDEKKLEEALALDLIQAVSEDENISDDIMSDIKKAHKITGKVRKTVEYAIKYGCKTAKDKEKIAKLLSGGLFTENDILVILESVDENQKQLKEDLKSLGIAFDGASMAINIILTMEASDEVVNGIRDNVEADSPLGRGLKRIDKTLKNTERKNVLPKLMEFGIDKCAEALVDVGSEFFAPVELGYYVIGALIPTKGIEDVNKAVISSSNYTQLIMARDEMISEIILNYRNGESVSTEELEKEYRLVYTAYLESLKSSVEYALKVATPAQKKKLQKSYNKVKDQLTYDKYIQSCIINASAYWTYDIKDGKAVITGCEVNTGTGGGGARAASGKAARAAEADIELYAIDIPNEIDGYSVAGIADGAFEGDEGLKCVTMPDGAEDIGESAFASCSSLDTVYMNSRLNKVGKSAFADCESLSDIKIPYSVKEIGDGAFKGTTELVIEAQSGTAGEEYADNNSDVSFESHDSEAVSISLKALPSKRTYKMSEEEVETSGLEVTAKYEDGTEKDVTEYCYSSFIDKKPGSVSVEVRFDELTASYDVEVTADECEYTVRYEDECGEEIAERSTGKAMAGEPLTLKAPEIKGYTADEQELTKEIGDFNEFVITYTSEPEISITEAKFTYEKKHKYTGEQIKPEVKVTYSGKTLTEGEDYYIDYDENTEAGTGSILICGIGGYCDYTWLEFEIQDAFFGSEDAVRIFGAGRYDTACEAADALKKSTGTEKFENIIVASGDDYPDALAGSYLAKAKKAPVLLVGKDEKTEAQIKEYIENNLEEGGTVYLLGGTGVVTDRFKNSLKNMEVKRLGGLTRYETNIAILKEAGAGDEDILVCTGDGFADSLSASAVGKPILLVDNRAGVTDIQKKYLKSIEINDIYLIGGTGVVGDNIGKQLAEYDTDGECDRVSGKNRYLTSVAVAEEFFTDGSDKAVLAYAMNFPDGLAGGPLALSLDAPLLLVDSNGYSDAVKYAKKAGIEKAAVLGGGSLVTDSVVKKIVQ